MKTFLLPLLLLLTFNAFAQTDADALLQKTNRNFFIENKGQWNPEVKFLAKIGGMNAWITQNGVVYDYYKIEKDYDEKTMRDMPEHEKEIYENEHTIIKGHVVRTTFANNNAAKEFEGENKEEAYYNYFLGNDESKWASYVPLYEGATVKDLYEGIDVKYYFDKGLLRYDFIVNPGADIEKINIELEGADDYKVNEKGELVVETSLGKVTHSDILAYQKRGGGTKEVAALFTKKENGKIGFEIGSYDKDKKLIIGPLVYSTYLGGSGNDYGRAIALDSQGNAYVAGYTYSTDFPVTSGAYQTTYGGGNYDAFVTKLNPDGSALIYSTYLGGSNEDRAYGITLENGGNAFIAGKTVSTNFPATSGAYQTSSGGSEDAFITKLDSGGGALAYSTYLGGSSNDYGNCITLDGGGNAFVTGGTGGNFPVTSGAYQTTNGGSSDAFVTKINPDGSALIYSTYLGGSSGESGKDITLDGGGNAFVTGGTGGNFPVTSGAYQTTHGGFTDAFVTKINSDGGALVYSTYLGGSSYDYGYNITLDGGGNVFVNGYTRSSDFPFTSGAYQTTYSGITDAFVTKLNSAGNALVYSTYLGGNDDDYICDITLDSGGNAFVTGYTFSTDFPVTFGAYQTTFGEQVDAFVTKLNSAGNALVYSTYLGGSGSDYGYGITLDVDGNAFVTGYTYSTDFSVTSRAYQTTKGGSSDAFVTKINIPSSVTATPQNGVNNICFNETGNETYMCLELDVNTVADITCSYYQTPPTNGSLPTGIDHAAQYYWVMTAPGISFVNGIVSAALTDLTGVTDATKLHWLKRSASGDPWTDIGGEVVGGELKSTVMFSSFSEFTIASIDATNPLPVELTTFTAIQKEDNIVLRWETATEVNAYSFQVERALLGDEEFEMLGEVMASGNSNSPKQYSFIDEEVNSGKYQYRLKMIDADGSYEYSDAVEVKVDLPMKYSLSQNYPNPFNPSTKIKYSIPETAEVKIVLYNIMGEVVAEFVNGEQEAGFYTLEVDMARFQNGLASGVYLYRMIAVNKSTGNTFVNVKKMILLK